MPIVVNSSGVSHARSLIRAGKVDRTSSWSFSGADGDAMLGHNENWENFGRHHLAVDKGAADNTKAYWKYPYGKGGRVYRRGVIAAKSRAAQQGATEIANAADSLLQMIDKDRKTITTLATDFVQALKTYFGLEEKEDVVAQVQAALAEAPAEVGAVGLENLPALANHDNPAVSAWAKQSLTTAASTLGLTGFKVFTDTEGQDWWFGWNTNKWLDREGQILTDEAHKEFKTYLDANPEKAPVLQTIHVPQTARKQRASWWNYYKGFFMYAGRLEPEEADVLRKDVGTPVGMSHGFYVIGQAGPRLPNGLRKYVTRYRTFEVSELPLNLAANPYTEFTTLQEKAKMAFDSVAREYLVTRFGEETVAELEQSTDVAAEAMDKLGVEWKSVQADYEAAIEAEKQKEADERAQKIVSEITTKVLETMNLESLQQVLTGLSEEIATVKAALGRLETVEEKVTHLMETEDARIAQVLSPVQPIDWTSGPTQKNTDVPDEDLSEEEKAAKADLQPVDWMKGLSPFK